MPQFNRVFLYAIIPALVAGFFSLAPKIYDVITEPKSELAYNVVDGPGLDIQGKIRKIYSVEVRNSGKKALSNIHAELRVSNGQIEQFKIEDASGIKPSTDLLNDTLSVNADNLHPTESFIISAMLLMPALDTNVAFNLRSKETLGKIRSEDSPKKNTKLDIIGAVLAGFSVFFMATLVASGRIPLIKTLMMGGKQDILYYITARVGLTDITNQLRAFDTSLTYLRTADIFLAAGLSKEELRPLAIKALKCMLLIRNIAPVSLNVVKRNVQFLEGGNYLEKEVNSLREESINISNYLELRDRVDRHLAEGSPHSE